MAVHLRKERMNPVRKGETDSILSANNEPSRLVTERMNPVRKGETDSVLSANNEPSRLVTGFAKASVLSAGQFICRAESTKLNQIISTSPHLPRFHKD